MPQGQAGWIENLVPTGIRSLTVQPLVSRYTDWATRPTLSHPTFLYSTREVLWPTVCAPSYDTKSQLIAHTLHVCVARDVRNKQPLIP